MVQKIIASSQASFLISRLELLKYMVQCIPHHRHDGGVVGFHQVMDLDAKASVLHSALKLVFGSWGVNSSELTSDMEYFAAVTIFPPPIHALAILRKALCVLGLHQDPMYGVGRATHAR